MCTRARAGYQTGNKKPDVFNRNHFFLSNMNFFVQKSHSVWPNSNFVGHIFFFRRLICRKVKLLLVFFNPRLRYHTDVHQVPVTYEESGGDLLRSIEEWSSTWSIRCNPEHSRRQICLERRKITTMEEGEQNLVEEMNLSIKTDFAPTRKLTWKIYDQQLHLVSQSRHNLEHNLNSKASSSSKGKQSSVILGRAWIVRSLKEIAIAEINAPQLFCCC